MQLYVFGYGSLTNPTSVAKTLPGKRATISTILIGYQRKINAPVNGYLYLNIVPQAHTKVEGVLIAITAQELETLKEREPGYARTDITDKLATPLEGMAYTFIAADTSYPQLKIPRSYLLTCLSGKTPKEKEIWLQQTIIENEIEEDSTRPVYANVAME